MSAPSQPSGARGPGAEGVLWILRHGKAADVLGLPDTARPLTDRGEAQAREAGETLRGLAPVLDAVLTSPRVRARTTAEHAVRAHGAAPGPIVIDELGDDYGLATLLALVSGWFADAGHVLVVGHNPTLSSIVEQLTGDVRGLSTGTLLGVDLGSREIVAYARPSN